MDAADLKIFESVARMGGMNRAAAELKTVQSNATARIRLLENELGAPLFHRHHRGVALTDAGRRLLPYAARPRRSCIACDPLPWSARSPKRRGELSGREMIAIT